MRLLTNPGVQVVADGSGSSGTGEAKAEAVPAIEHICQMCEAVH